MNPNLEIVAVNDLGDVDNLAYLLKYDSVYGRWAAEIKSDALKRTITVEGREISVLQEKDPSKLPWKDLSIDVVVECTGLFESFEKSAAHLVSGAKRAVISAPAKDEDGEIGATILMGINDGEISRHELTSNGSCTTNAAAPVMAIMAESPGIVKAVLDTVHGYTATQNLVDGPVRGGKDFRRGRAAAQNIVPSTTGAALAVTRVVPELKGKFDGIAMRVPVVSGSIADITFLAKRKVTVGEINDIFRKAVKDPRWEGMLKISEDQIVSSDVLGEPYGAVVDLTFTKVVDGDLVKVLSWYDNEYGYAATLVRHVLAAARCVK